MSTEVLSNSKRKRRVNGAVVNDRRPARPAPAAGPVTSGAAPAASAVRPWHLVLGMTLIAVVASVVATSGTSTANTVSIAGAIAATGLVATAFFRSVLPFVSPETSEQTEMLGGQTRAALDREKMLVLRAIKEVEFDRAMRKVSEADYHDMVTRLRSRAAGLIRQLDGGAGYRELIERDVAVRLGASGAARTRGPETASEAAVAVRPQEEAAQPVSGTCAACGGANDLDARFCKSCGSRLTGVGAA